GVAIVDRERSDLLGRGSAVPQQLGHRHVIELAQEFVGRPARGEGVPNLFYGRLNVFPEQTGVRRSACAAYEAQRRELAVVPGGQRIQPERLYVVLNEVMGLSEGL